MKSWPKSRSIFNILWKTTLPRDLTTTFPPTACKMGHVYLEMFIQNYGLISSFETIN